VKGETSRSRKEGRREGGKEVRREGGRDGRMQQSVSRKCDHLRPPSIIRETEPTEGGREEGREGGQLNCTHAPGTAQPSILAFCNTACSTS